MNVQLQDRPAPQNSHLQPQLQLQALMDVARRPDAVFTRGRGSWLWDSQGRSYLDRPPPGARARAHQRRAGCTKPAPVAARARPVQRPRG
jgi:hypothetical protein